jgi:hypothetical protein
MKVQKEDALAEAVNNMQLDKDDIEMIESDDDNAVCGILRSGEQTRIESCIIQDSRIHG